VFMPAASSKPFKVQFVVKAATREAAERIVNAAMREAFEPEKELQVSEFAESHNENVDANGVKISDADKRDRGSTGKGAAPIVDIDANRGAKI
jgi:hypothetical protein